MRIRLRAKKVNRSVWGNIAVFTMLALTAAFMGLPLLFVISNAFKPLNEFYLYPPRFFPQNWTLTNFKNLFIQLSNSWVPITRYLFNTVFITIVGTTAHVFFASLAAYALAKHNFPGKKIIFTSIVMSLMFTSNTLGIAQYIILSKLGLIDSQFSIIALNIGAALGLFLMKQFMEGVPDSLLESARMDGASELRVFWQIAMPSVKPATLTLIILQVQGLWYNTGSSFLYSEQLKTLPVALSQIMQGGIAFGGMGAAAMLIIISVPILVFVINQANVVRTFTTSGIKE